MSKTTPVIPVAKPWMGLPEIRAVKRAILSGWVTQGPEVAAFEEEFCKFTGAIHACAVSSCTTALHLALMAVGVRPGDEVIAPSHSFIATANSIRYCGAVPVFVDISPETFNINTSLIEKAITGKTRAILCVHQLGMPCDLESILRIARHHKLKVVEDAACAIGSEILWRGRWERIGKPHGDVACFSFHPRKLLTTGDGGMITTSHAKLDAEFKLLRQHGMSIPDTVRHSSQEMIFESYTRLGFNYRMTDIQASIGREQLKRIPRVVEKRRRQAHNYMEMLGGIKGLGCPEEPAWARSNWQSFCVRLPEGCDQKRTMDYMLRACVATRRGVMCSHREPAYKHEEWVCGHGKRMHLRCKLLRESELAQGRTIILPLFHKMTVADQKNVSKSLSIACQQAQQVVHDMKRQYK